MALNGLYDTVSLSGCVIVDDSHGVSGRREVMTCCRADHPIAFLLSEFDGAGICREKARRG